jgi:hypothetical protein
MLNFWLARSILAQCLRSKLKTRKVSSEKKSGFSRKTLGALLLKGGKQRQQNPNLRPSQTPSRTTKISNSKKPYAKHHHSKHLFANGQRHPSGRVR